MRSFAFFQKATQFFGLDNRIIVVIDTIFFVVALFLSLPTWGVSWNYREMDPLWWIYPIFYYVVVVVAILLFNKFILLVKKNSSDERRGGNSD